MIITEQQIRQFESWQEDFVRQIETWIKKHEDKQYMCSEFKKAQNHIMSCELATNLVLVKLTKKKMAIRNPIQIGSFFEQYKMQTSEILKIVPLQEEYTGFIAKKLESLKQIFNLF